MSCKIGHFNKGVSHHFHLVKTEQNFSHKVNIILFYFIILKQAPHPLSQEIRTESFYNPVTWMQALKVIRNL